MSILMQPGFVFSGNNGTRRAEKGVPEESITVKRQMRPQRVIRRYV